MNTGTRRPELVELLLQHGSHQLDTATKKRLRLCNKRCAILVDATWEGFTTAGADYCWPSLFSVARLGRPPSLNTLELADLSAYHDDEVRTIAQLVLPHLEILQVHRAAFGLRGLVTGKWAQLGEFAVDNLRMSASDMMDLRQSVWKDLGALELESTAIGGREMASLAAAFPNLTELRLHDIIDITEEGAAALAQGFPHLSSLELGLLEWSTATEEVFTALAAAAWPQLDCFYSTGKRNRPPCCGFSGT